MGASRRAVLAVHRHPMHVSHMGYIVTGLLLCSVGAGFYGLTASRRYVEFSDAHDRNWHRIPRISRQESRAREWVLRALGVGLFAFGITCLLYAYA